jgi:hypothetical protein
MGLFSGIGHDIRGLLGRDGFLERLAQAQAFAHGDPLAAARIGEEIRKLRERRDEAPLPIGAGRDSHRIGGWR